MGVHTVVYPKIHGAPTPRSHSLTRQWACRDGYPLSGHLQPLQVLSAQAPPLPSLASPTSTDPLPQKVNQTSMNSFLALIEVISSLCTTALTPHKNPAHMLIARFALYAICLPH